MKDMTAEKLKSPLNLVPLSIEGGYFAEPYRSTEMISRECLHGRYSGSRSVSAALYCDSHSSGSIENGILGLLHNRVIRF